MNKRISRYLAPSTLRYIFGCTDEAKALVTILNRAGYPVTAVIDTYYPEDSFAGLPRITLEQVPKTALILSAVTNSRPIDVNQLLEKAGYQYIDYFSFYRLSGLDCPKIPFWHDPNKHFNTNKEKYQVVRSLLADKASKDTFDAIVNFRNSYDLKYMAGFKYDLQSMYFESFLPTFKPNSIFYDLGAFDGGNTQCFLQHCSTGDSYLFEPIPSTKKQLSEKFAADSRCHVVNAAVGNDNGIVLFDVDGTSSKIAENGHGVSVPILSLDVFSQQQGIVPSYIKMDVEGFEQQVLLGAEKLIRTHKPMLAVSVYHKVEHLIDLPLLLAEYNPDYQFYLKHYTQGYSETVLFAVDNTV